VKSDFEVRLGVNSANILALNHNASSDRWHIWNLRKNTNRENFSKTKRLPVNPHQAELACRNETEHSVSEVGMNDNICLSPLEGKFWTVCSKRQW